MTAEEKATSAARDEVRAWLAERWSPGLDQAAWRGACVDAGWSVPTWPTAWYGRGWDRPRSLVVAEEFARAGAPFGGLDTQYQHQPIELQIGGTVIVSFGQDSLKESMLRPILMGERRGCLLYSEPGAGSDLAAVQTRAQRDGDEWVFEGQKVWTTAGREADFGLLIARTDWDQPKHRGISYFVLPMRQPGVEVRPLRQMTGEAHFNQVFLSGARAPIDHQVGELNEGWRILQVALAYERLAMGSAARGATDHRRVPVGPGLDLVELARSRGRASDPVVRQALAQLYVLRTVIAWNAQRSAAGARAGGVSPAATRGQQAMERVLHSSASLADSLLGATGTLYGPGAPEAQTANTSLMMAFMNSIGGGSDQIQRNIIGERILGLPKDIQVDRDRPFRDVPKASRSSSSPEVGPSSG